MIEYLKSIDRSFLTLGILLAIVLFYYDFGVALFAFAVILFYGIIEDLLGYLLDDTPEEE